MYYTVLYCTGWSIVNPTCSYYSPGVGETERRQRRSRQTANVAETGKGAPADSNGRHQQEETRADSGRQGQTRRSAAELAGVSSCSAQRQSSTATSHAARAADKARPCVTDNSRQPRKRQGRHSRFWVYCHVSSSHVYLKCTAPPPSSQALSPFHRKSPGHVRVGIIQPRLPVPQVAAIPEAAKNNTKTTNQIRRRVVPGSLPTRDGG